MTGNITQVTEAAGETGVSASHVLDAAGELSSQAEQLSTEVANFLYNIRNR